MLSWLKNKINHKYHYKSYTKIEGWLTPAEAAGLFEIATSLKTKSMVLEIGSWKGKKHLLYSNGIKKGVINCIDPFNADGEAGSKEIYEKVKGDKTLLDQFQTNLSGIPSSVEINTLVGYSNQFVDRITGIDFLFVDGDHSIEGCKYDFENYSKDIKPGGYIGFHDYDANRKDLGPTWVIDNLVKTNSSYSFYKKFDSLMIFRKIKIR